MDNLSFFHPADPRGFTGMTSSAGGAKGCSDHRFHAPPAYTAKLLTLRQHGSNYQYRMAKG